MKRVLFQQLTNLKNASIKGKKIADCYHLLYRENIWMEAFNNLSLKNDNDISKDPISQDWASELIEKIKGGSIRFKKTNHLLGISEGTLLKEVVRIILRSIYD